MKFFMFVGLMFCAICTYLTLLIGNIAIGYYMGPGVVMVTGLAGMICVGWQVKMAVLKLIDFVEGK